MGLMSLRQFVCNALDFSYEQSPTSKAILDLEGGASIVKPLWNNHNMAATTGKTSPVDIYSNFKEKRPVKN